MPVLPRGYNTVTFDDVDESVETVSAVPATLFGYTIANSAAAASYIKFYDATAPTVGTTEPKLVIAVATVDGASQEFVGGITFGTAITVASVTTPEGSTGSATNDVSLTALYLPGTRRSGN